MAIGSGTPTISSAGIGSGLDVNGIVTSLLAVEKQPLARLQSASSAMQTKLSEFGQIQSLVSTLHDAAAPLFSPNSFTLTNAGSSDPSSVSAGTSIAATPGLYTVSVSALSAGQSVVSPTGQFVDGTSPVGTGTLTIRLGTWNAGQTAFTPKSGSLDVAIPVGASDNTLAGIRDKINAAGAGVSATLVTDAGGSRLALASTTTGAENGFRVTVADDDGSNANNLGLSRLAYDPAGGAGQLTLAQPASNTQATINGIAVSSVNNTLSTVVNGVTFSLGKVTTSPVTINVTRNTDSIKGQLNNFVSAYNALNNFLSLQTKYDPASKTSAPLQGDSTAVSIQNQLHQQITQVRNASTVFGTFSALGVQLQKDGSLSVNDATISTALTNLPEVTKALSHLDSATPANVGLAKGFSDWTDKLLGSTGTLAGKTASIQSGIAANQKSQDAMTLRLSLVEQRMRAQYSALDETMSKANSLAKYVTQQFSNNNNNNNN